MQRARRRLWVIDPSLKFREAQGVQEILQGWAGSSRVFEPGLDGGAGGPGPQTGYETDGVVLLGSAASVHDRHAWLGALAEWLAPLLHGEVRLPLLGVCFGHQLIAQLAGGNVGYVGPDHEKLVGVATTRLDGGRLLGGSGELRVVVSHREEVQQLPPGYRVTATRPESAIDGLEHERLPIFSFQFHPEAREEFARHAGIDLRGIDVRVREDGRRLLAAFLEHASGVR